MKLRVEKDGQRIKIELTADTAKKPLTLDMSVQQFENWLAVLQAARAADRLVIALEL